MSKEQMRRNSAHHTLSFHDTEVTESASLDKSHRRVTYNSNALFQCRSIPTCIFHSVQEI